MAPQVDAASIIVTTSDGSVLVGERHIDIPFLGGYCVFPGGSLEESDRRAGFRLGIDPLICCAIREMIEETGVVIDGARVRPVRPEERGRPIEELDITIDASRFFSTTRWISPEYAPPDYRFDARFFLVEVENTCETDPREFSYARFEPASSWLERWRRFEILLVPMSLIALEALEHGTRGAVARMRAIDTASWLDFEPISGIRQLPLRTPTLPPAEHTNAYVIGHERLLVVDPATYELSEREMLLSLIETLGKDVQAVLLTHHHRDHTGAANWLRKQLGCPVLAHPRTKELVEPKIPIDQTIEEGTRIDLGKDRAGYDFLLEVLATPGHAPGHVVLDDLRPGARSLIVGDMVAAIGTIIVDPSEGDMAEYLRQLRRLRALPEKVIFPAHGPPIVAGHQKLDEYVAHRLMREEKVYRALQEKREATAWDLLPLAYDDTNEKIWPLAERSCLAHLLKLVADGRAVRDGERFAIG